MNLSKVAKLTSISICTGGVYIAYLIYNRKDDVQINFHQCDNRGNCKINGTDDWQDFLQSAKKTMPIAKTITFNQVKFEEHDNIDMPLNEAKFVSCQGCMNILKSINADSTFIDTWIDKIPGWEAGLWDNVKLMDVMVHQRPVVLPVMEIYRRCVAVKKMGIFDVVLIDKGDSEASGDDILNNIVNSTSELEYIKYYRGYRNVIRQPKTEAMFYIQPHKQGDII
jgi:hypothetical protein